MMCNLDCFNCIHDDCISDEVSLSERQSQARLDSQIRADKPIKRRNRDKTKNRMHQATYYSKNRNDEVERVKEYNKIHADERRAYARAYYHANKGKKVG